MAEGKGNEVTRLLAAVGKGDPAAMDELLPLIYENLRSIAGRQMAAESPGHTLQPTALVHEAYLRLLGDAQANWESRGHFYGVAASAMRRILVDRARHRKRIKRGGGRQRIPLDDVEISIDGDPEDLLALDRALTELQARNPRMHDVVMLRHFAGLTSEQAAKSLGLSARTIKRDWSCARLWLVEAMRDEASRGGS